MWCVCRHQRTKPIHDLCRIADTGFQRTADYVDRERQAVKKKVDVLFVQNARNVSFSKGKLILRGVNPVTVCFTDRPARMAGHMQTSRLIPLWSQGKDSFLKDNPNATLSIFRGDNVSDLVVELGNPQLSGNDLTYDARILEGTPPVNGGVCALFIDIIGMPATPMSYAGVTRRGFRRGY